MAGALQPQTKEGFATALARRNIVLLALTFGWPFMLYAVMWQFGLHGIAGFAISLYLKPVIYIVFLLFVVAICRSRFKDIGLSYWWLALLAMLLLLGLVFWTVASAPWSVGFALGAMGGIPPSAIASFSCLAALCVLPSGYFKGPVPLTSGRKRNPAPALVILLALCLVSEIAWLAISFTTRFDVMTIIARARSWVSPAFDAIPIIIGMCIYREITTQPSQSGATRLALFASYVGV